MVGGDGRHAHGGVGEADAGEVCPGLPHNRLSGAWRDERTGVGRGGRDVARHVLHARGADGDAVGDHVERDEGRFAVARGEVVCDGDIMRRVILVEDDVVDRDGGAGLHRERQ